MVAGAGKVNLAECSTSNIMPLIYAGELLKKRTYGEKKREACLSLRRITKLKQAGQI
jgi:hypothetical protein